MIKYKNREHAGKLLAEKLMEYKTLNPVILALPRGGVPLAFEISSKLEASLDVLFVKKIGDPSNEEFAIGAIAEDEQPILNGQIIKEFKINENEVARIIIEKITEIRRKSKFYRKIIPKISLEGRNVIIVDDGLATGATMEAALNWIKTKNTKKVIVAVAVASVDAFERIKKLGIDCIALQTPPEFWAVGIYFEDFTQVSDKEVLQYFTQKKTHHTVPEHKITIENEDIKLHGILNIPEKSKGIIIFAHGSGSSHQSPRNIYVANALNKAGFGTLLFDLLTTNESLDRANVFDIELLVSRLILATKWLKNINKTLPIGYFGASTGAAAALGAEAYFQNIFAVVSRGGRPDMAMEYLPKIKAPTLLLVGENDQEVISLNKLACTKIADCELVTIPKAGHLFEESGTLEQVVEYAITWFSEKVSDQNKDKKQEKYLIQENIIKEIENNSTPFKNIDDLDFWLNKISRNRIVMLGEATHGTKEFYQIRSEISKKLINSYGFDFIAVEGDWPSCYNVNQYIKNEIKDDSRKVLKNEFHRWPTWMWSNIEISSLVDWMKTTQKGGFYGLDVYSLFESVEEINKNTSFLDDNISKTIELASKCFKKFESNENEYAKSLVKNPNGCHEEAYNALQTILRLKLKDTKLTKNDFFNTQQNARVVLNSEKYYRAMLSGDASSWNIRDTHMMETIEHLLQFHGANSKAIIWAHNTHIGDYHATDMIDNGYINLGGLAREKYGMENVALVGLSSFKGYVTAGNAWGSEEKIMPLPEARKGSYDEYFHQAALKMNSSQFLTTFDKLDPQSTLYRKLGQRAVGVVYQSEHESIHNYVPTQMANRYDSLIFVDETRALESIPSSVYKQEIPETYPQGM